MILLNLRNKFWLLFIKCDLGFIVGYYMNFNIVLLFFLY
jgi:hypothetical protein